MDRVKAWYPQIRPCLPQLRVRATKPEPQVTPSYLSSLVLSAFVIMDLCACLAIQKAMQALVPLWHVAVCGDGASTLGKHN